MKSFIFKLLPLCLIVSFNMLHAQRLYFAVEDNNLVKRSPLQINFVEKNSLNEAIILYQDDFVTHDSKQNYNEGLLKKSINKRIPDKNYSGIALLDWEGSKARILYGSQNISKKKFNEVLQEFVSAIRMAKKLRPNVKWSYYGFPVRTSNAISYDKWTKQMLALKSLYKEMDYICPNLYMFIRSDTKKYNEDINQHLAFSLRIGKELGKEVFPLVWNRYQTNSELIPLNVFNSHISKISKISYANKKINGLIWWNSEEFNYIRRERYPKIKAEYSTIRNKASYQMDLLTSYLTVIRNNNFK